MSEEQEIPKQGPEAANVATDDGDNNQTIENPVIQKNKPSFLRRHYGKMVMAVMLAAGLFGTKEVTTQEQGKVNAEHAQMDHAFQISDLTTEAKIRQVIATTIYSSKKDEQLNKWLAKNANTEMNDYDNVPNAGQIQLYMPEMKSLEETKKIIEKMRRKSSIPVLISADLEGGYVNHNKFTKQDYEKFGMPKEIFEMRDREQKAISEKHEKQDIGLGILPSEEWIGREYSQIWKNDEKRKAFLEIMTQYGKSIGKMCEYLGINMVLGPVLDKVENINAEDNPISNADRAYSENVDVIIDLGVAYIRGFAECPGVIPVPKHFVGDGNSIVDPHKAESTANIGKNSGALIPFKFAFDGYLLWEKKNLEKIKTDVAKLGKQLIEKNKEHSRAKNPKQRSKIVTEIINMKTQLRQLNRQIREIETKGSGNSTKAILMSTVGNNVYGQDSSIPTVYNQAPFRALRRSKDANGFGFKGVVITDDLTMQSASRYIASKYKISDEKAVEAMSIYEALKTGNDIVFIKNVGENLDGIVHEVAELINKKIDADKDGQPDVTVEHLNQIVEKILEMKVRMGLMDEAEIRGKRYYLLNSQTLNPTTLKVLRDSFFSNQWPWLSKDEYYKNEGVNRKKNDLQLAYEATKNFILSLYRVINNSKDVKYTGDGKEPRKLIVIDKSAREMFIYDEASGTLEKHLEIAIGSGTQALPPTADRRIFGDKKTPTGYYEVVEKRDGKDFEDNPEKQEFYGGENGGMLVLAGPWHPNIAIHGTTKETTGAVSNGCIRTSDATIQELMKTIKIGTKVVITN